MQEIRGLLGRADPQSAPASSPNQLPDRGVNQRPRLPRNASSARLHAPDSADWIRAGAE